MASVQTVLVFSDSVSGTCIVDFSQYSIKLFQLTPESEYPIYMKITLHTLYMWFKSVSQLYIHPFDEQRA